MSSLLPILFAADLNEILSVLGALVVFVIWLINQINDAKKKQQAQVVRPQPELPPQPAGQAAAAAEVPPADPLRTQIDEFLRRAAQQKLAQPAAPLCRGSRPGATKSSCCSMSRWPLRQGYRWLTECVRRAKRPRLRATPSPPRQPPRAVKPGSPKRAAPQRVAPQRPRSVAEHVAEHVGVAAQEFRKEVADLGERVKQADEQFDRPTAKEIRSRRWAVWRPGQRAARATSRRRPDGDTRRPNRRPVVQPEWRATGSHVERNPQPADGPLVGRTASIVVRKIV